MAHMHSVTPGRAQLQCLAHAWAPDAEPAWEQTREPEGGFQGSLRSCTGSRLLSKPALEHPMLSQLLRSQGKLHPDGCSASWLALGRLSSDLEQLGEQQGQLECAPLMGPGGTYGRALPTLFLAVIVQPAQVLP